MPRFTKRTGMRGRPRKGYGRIYRRKNPRTGIQRRLMRASASAIYRPTHYFSRGTAPTVTALTNNTAGIGATGFVSFGQTYQLSDVINVADFTSLYDQYKIISVIQFFKWSLDPTIADNIVNNPPVCHYFTDHDDSSTPSHNELQERATTKSFVMRPNKLYKILIKPAVLQEVYKSSLTTGFVPKWGQFLDMVDNNTPHFGLKVGWSYGGATAYGSIHKWYRVLIACKGVR